MSKVPIFDGVIDDRSGIVNPDPANEQFVSFEAGLDFRSTSRALAGKLNAYSTTWRDRTITRNINLIDGSESLINLAGLDARHTGGELELSYQPVDVFRFDGAVSVGNWEYLKDVTGSYRPDGRTEEVTEYEFYVDGLKVGDASQTQFAYGFSFFPTRGMYLNILGRTYARNYADFDPLSRTNSLFPNETDADGNPGDRGIQSWQAPGYTVVDANFNYALPLQDFPLRIDVFAHVFNLLNATYIQDAPITPSSTPGTSTMTRMMPRSSSASRARSTSARV